jgi:Cof subfamily protein (haloacid dehalogenase superfamily)
MLNQLIVFDVDGTLLSDSNRLKKTTLDGIKELQKRKIPYTLASGRSFHFCRSLASKLEVNIPIITCNGSLIQSAFTGQVIFQNLLPRKFIKQVLTDLNKHQELFNLYLTFTHSLVIPAANRTRRKSRSSFPVKVVDSFEYLDFDSLVKITIEFFDEKSMNGLRQFLLQTYGDVLSITPSDDRSIDITAFQSNKGEAVKKLAALLDVSSVFAFGNHHNDLEMLQFATVGIAMSNAKRIVRESADYVTLSNNEDGILSALNHLVFK